MDSEPGEVIDYFLKVIGPAQHRVYCRPATMTQKLNYARIGHPNAVFSSNQPLGLNSINLLMKLALERIGYPGGTGHALRRVFGSTLANDPSVSTEAGLDCMRQTSVASYRMYQVVGKKTEAAKFAALGIEEGDDN